MSEVPVLPETAPFTPAQRAWLNGFFAGLLSAEPLAAAAAAPAAEPDEDFPWHDPTLALDERMKLADGHAPPRRLMAAMGQLDCGQCGYLCKTYAEAIASGAEKDLTRCVPGGKPTAKLLKVLVAEAPPPPAPAAPAASSGHAIGHDRREGRPGSPGHRAALAQRAAEPVRRGEADPERRAVARRHRARLRARRLARRLAGEPGRGGRAPARDPAREGVGGGHAAVRPDD